MLNTNNILTLPDTPAAEIGAMRHGVEGHALDIVNVSPDRKRWILRGFLIGTFADKQLMAMFEQGELTLYTFCEDKDENWENRVSLSLDFAPDAADEVEAKVRAILAGQSVVAVKFKKKLLPGQVRGYVGAEG